MKRKKRYRNWTTREGDVIPIDQMETSHIENTLRFISRQPAYIRKDAKQDVQQMKEILRQRDCVKWNKKFHDSIDKLVND